MSRSDPVSPWVATVSTHLPHLSGPQARCLAAWSYAVAVTHCAGTSSAATFLAAVRHERENTVRQRLREWYQEASHKRGAQRRQMEASTCFAALLGWVLAWWPADERRLALALDATSLRDCFTVLSVSVVYRGCAIPVAWAVTRANTPGAWRPHWERLLRLLGRTLPADWLVLVLADRGLYARWLFMAIQEQGWRPFLRVTTSGLCRPVTPTGVGTAQRLADLAPRVGTAWCGQAQCFTTADRWVRCTVLACWEAPHADRWLILTDLAPTQAEVAWYGLRGWIEQGFKDLKRGGWGWQHTKMTDPARAERLWVVLAVATLWMVSVGAQAEGSVAEPMAAGAVAVSGIPTLPTAVPTAVRRLSLFRRGRLLVLATLVAGGRAPLGYFPRSLWPRKQPVGSQPVSGFPPIDDVKAYP